MRLIRIERKNMYRVWATCLVAGVIVFAVMAFISNALETDTGAGIYHLQQLSTAAEFRAVRVLWLLPDNALKAGFLLGLDYLFIPLYVVTFFWSGAIAQEGAPARAALLRRVLAVATLVPLLCGALDAVENALEFYLLQPAYATDTLAVLAFRISNVKIICFYVGVVLLIASIFSVVVQYQRRKLPS